jgi:hypothetical protein
MHNLITAHGLNPSESGDSPSNDAVKPETPVGTTERVRRALPTSGTFGVEEVMANGNLSDIGKPAVSLILWKLAAAKEIKTVMKGTRTSAASYSRN